MKKRIKYIVEPPKTFIFVKNILYSYHIKITIDN